MSRNASASLSAVQWAALQNITLEQGVLLNQVKGLIQLLQPDGVYFWSFTQVWQWALEQSLWMCKESVLATSDAQTGAPQQEPALHAWVQCSEGFGCLLQS